MTFLNRNVSDKEYNKLKEWYSHEILKRDKEIEGLKKEKMILLKTALRQANINLPDGTDDQE